MPPLILPVQGVYPTYPKTCFIAPNATLVGDVSMGEECSVWFQAVLRADVHWIRMGNRVNIQDGVVIHGTYQKHGTTIGSNVSIGHRAILHGCTVHDNVLVGMGAIVMDGAVVHSYSIIAAGAVVLAGTVVPERCIFGGTPARKLKDIPEEKVKNDIERTARNYVLYASWFS